MDSCASEGNPPPRVGPIEPMDTDDEPIVISTLENPECDPTSPPELSEDVDALLLEVTALQQEIIEADDEVAPTMAVEGEPFDAAAAQISGVDDAPESEKASGEGVTPVRAG